MSQSFVKGRTTNHLTWVMVDATDFATPESAASAATTIKIYGKLRAAAGVNFVSSGTGSLTNDITHVGASATGIYSIGLAKADLSDASAAWYDQYIITLSATGCARQTLVVDGGIDASALSAYQSRFSDIQSYLVALSATLSDTHSAAILGASHASDAHSAATLAASRALLNQSRISDVQSYLIALSDQLSDAHSDLASKLGDVSVTITASDISDIASAVAGAVGSVVSDAHSAAAQANSRILLVQSRLSDLDSRLASETSDIYSLLSDLHSDVGVLSGIASDAHSAAILAASHASDAHSAATLAASRALLTQSLASDAHSAAAQANSRALVAASTLSDVQSQITAFSSDFQSRVPKAVATDSQVESLFNAAIPDSVPADGTVPSVRQALYMINQYLHERSVSGTTVTVKKADGSTTLLQCTINDASTPTSITRSS